MENQSQTEERSVQSEPLREDVPGGAQQVESNDEVCQMTIEELSQKSHTWLQISDAIASGDGGRLATVILVLGQALMIFADNNLRLLDVVCNSASTEVANSLQECTAEIANASVG